MTAQTPAASTAPAVPAASARAGVAMTAWSLHVPGVDLAAAVPALAAAAPAVAKWPACPPEAAAELLGRKGLLGKDPATRLALCAVHRALGLPARSPREQGSPDPDVAVVASSNFGNVATVVDIVRSVRQGGRSGVSPLAAPNASSNSLASAVAIWFRFGGPNLLVCSGATAGLDAVALGALLLRAGRARRVVVVGAEPADEVAVALQECRAAPPAPLRAGAACVILEPPAAAPGAPLAGPVRSTLGEPPVDRGGAALVIGPAGTAPAGTPAVDLTGGCGDLYGALGVAQAAVAAAIATAGTSPGLVRVVSGDVADGWRTLDIAPLWTELRSRNAGGRA